MPDYSNDIVPEGYNGESFTPFMEPEAQVTAKDEKRDATLSQLPLLKEVIEHLDKQISFFNSIDSVATNLSSAPEIHQRICAANKLARDKLIIERSFIQSRVDNL